MKANKITLIAQTIGMYVMHLPLYIFLILFNIPSAAEFFDKVSGPLLISFFVLTALVFPICIINAVFSVITVFKGEESPSKVSMVVKLALIPWYIMNFIICICLLSGMLNPFLFLAVPIVAAILICSTYIYMFSTSLPDIVYFINRLIKKKLKINALIIVSLVFLFIFCLDIAGGVMYHIAMNKNEK